ncbi:hypothetical protein GKE82_05925 [Conexibacter sp. W3-3-2]|uniref:hypothetical protein n=1 Tax=Conexibacter sp. W3-3-2 TaxID=2675227 RepID=UPI0012B904CE|nr:hypothetical protein [Conexibacter sp. W3-3-2]MTD43854.1 hypothetical protein [Conexibacter sp. W3-3-2]
MFYGQQPAATAFGAMGIDPCPSCGTTVTHAHAPAGGKLPEHKTLVYVRDFAAALLIVLAVPFLLRVLWRRPQDVVRAVVR